MRCEDCNYYRKMCAQGKNELECDVGKKQGCSFCSYYKYECTAYGSMKNHVKGCNQIN